MSCERCESLRIACEEELLFLFAVGAVMVLGGGARACVVSVSSVCCGVFVKEKERKMRFRNCQCH